MKHLTFAFILTFFLNSTIFGEELFPESFSEEQMKLLTESESLITKGLSSDQIVLYGMMMQRFRKERARDYSKTNTQPMASFEDQLKKRLDSASANEKILFEVVVKYILDNLTELEKKYPLAFTEKNNRYIFPFEIRSGTPNLNAVPEEKLKEYGNNVSEIKKKYAAIVSKVKEIHSLKVNVSCVNDSECLLLPYGRTLAKGPVGYFTLSRRNINLSIFAERLAELGKLETEIQNELRGFNSVESIITPPAVACEKNVCGFRK